MRPRAQIASGCHVDPANSRRSKGLRKVTIIQQSYAMCVLGQQGNSDEAGHVDYGHHCSLFSTHYAHGGLKLKWAYLPQGIVM